MLKDYIYTLKKRERDYYRRRLRDINKNKKRLLQMKFLEIKFKETFKDCHISKGSNYISLYLNKNYNISKDVMLFFEVYEYLLNVIGQDTKYTFEHDQDTESYDYLWPELRISVYYGSGKCKKVKVGETSKIVKKTLYKVECL